jgi:hypothetical protein
MGSLWHPQPIISGWLVGCAADIGDGEICAHSGLTAEDVFQGRAPEVVCETAITGI